MDGPGWHVEVEALEQAARGISESVRDQDNVELRELCGDTSLYGHGGLHAALMNFCTRWSEELDYLNDDAQDIADSLDRVAQKYRETDQLPLERSRIPLSRRLRTDGRARGDRGPRRAGRGQA